MRPNALSWRTSYAVPKGRQSQSKLQCTENWKKPLNPHSDCRPDHPSEFYQYLPYLDWKATPKFSKRRGILPNCFAWGNQQYYLLFRCQWGCLHSRDGTIGHLMLTPESRLFDWLQIRAICWSSSTTEGLLCCQITWTLWKYSV